MKKNIKKIITGITMGVMVFTSLTFTTLAEESMQCIVGNTEGQAPQYTPNLVYQSGANNPKEQTRFEGVPNLLGTGNTVGNIGYQKLTDENYCTFLDSNGKNPYLYYSNNSFKDGLYVIEMDAAMPSDSNSQTIFQLHLTNTDNGNVILNLLRFSGSADTSFPSFTNYKNYLNETNYELYRRVNTISGGDITENNDAWIRVSMRLDMTEHVVDLYLDDLPIIEKMPLPAEQNISQAKGFRVTKQGGGIAYLDNYYLIHYPRYNKELLNQSILLKNGVDTAYVKRVPIKIDRHNPKVVPYGNDDVSYLPLRFVAEYYDYYGNLETARENINAGNIVPGKGTSIEYDDATGMIYIHHKNKIWTMEAGSTTYTCDGQDYTLAAPVVIDGRTMVSMESIAKIFEVNVYMKEGKYLITPGCGVTEEDFDNFFANLEVE